jgi:hypothetical protein
VKALEEANNVPVGQFWAHMPCVEEVGLSVQELVKDVVVHVFDILLIESVPLDPQMLAAPLGEVHVKALQEVNNEQEGMLVAHSLFGGEV